MYDINDTNVLYKDIKTDRLILKREGSVLMDNISIKMLVAVEQLIEQPEDTFDIVEKYGKAVILKNNKPSYVLTKYEEDGSLGEKRVIAPNYKLHEAMRIVLNEHPEKMMHATELADEIYNRGLYRKKDDTKAMANQIRARSEKYDHLFEVQSKNMIKLR
jgi:antitoxin Phd